MQFVRCDLIVRRDFLEHRSVQILLDVLQTKAFRKDLSLLPGYETSVTGTVIDEV
jgi:molybdate-binding protein